MFDLFRTLSFLIFVIGLLDFSLAQSDSENSSEAKGFVFSMQRGASHAENPLKGLVPYARPTPNRFPHSMEFNYLPFSKLNVGVQKYDWTAMEELLDDIASRGNQAVIRIYLEYPGRTGVIPEYLIEGGLRVETYLNTNTAPFPPTEVSTPDYEDPNLRQALADFIAAFGARYDGDPRLGFITAGLLGTWGEWHTYPRNDLWASKETQEMVLDAYEKAFQVTPVLLRYPAGVNHYDKAQTSHRRFGYHDDSLCWATLPTGRNEDNWFFVPALMAAGPGAVDRWKTHPIGGEIRPEVWGKIFDAETGIPQAQPFDECAKAIHLTWTMDSGMFRREPAPADRYERAIQSVSQIGYDFYLEQATVVVHSSQKTMELEVEIVNQGIAPFYYDWLFEVVFAPSVEAAPSDSQPSEASLIKTFELADWTLRGQLPSDEPLRRTASISIDSIPSGQHLLLLRVKNPLPNGKPLKFANQSQDETLPGFLTIGTIQIP